MWQPSKAATKSSFSLNWGRWMSGLQVWRSTWWPRVWCPSVGWGPCCVWAPWSGHIFGMEFWLALALKPSRSMLTAPEIETGRVSKRCRRTKKVVGLSRIQRTSSTPTFRQDATISPRSSRLVFIPPIVCSTHGSGRWKVAKRWVTLKRLDRGFGVVIFGESRL